MTIRPFALLLVLACGAQPDGGDSVTVVDSAGIRIVDNPRPRWSGDSAWSVDTAPQMVIGADSTVSGDGVAARASLLSQVMDALRTRDGGVAVVDMTDDAIRYFDSAGHYVRTAGRSGDGPGEFRSIFGLIRVPEGLLATTMDGRSAIYNDSGRFVRTFSSPGWSPFAAFANGILVARKGITGNVINVVDPASTSRSVTLDSQELHTLQPNGTPGEPLGKFPQAYSVPLTEDPSSGFVSADGRGPLVFSARGFEAVSGSTLYSIFGDRAEIVARDGGKRVTMIARLRIPAIAVDESHRQKLHELRLTDPETGRRVTGEVEAMVKKRLAKMTFADSFPSLAGLITDAEGFIWVRRHRIADALPDPVAKLEPRRWSVLDSLGNWLTDVTLPANLGVTEIGLDYVLGIARDADGVPSVRLHTLRRGPR